jgi:putative membrane protein insertion efficiency factor
MLKWVFILLVKAYQLAISPFLAKRCRFYPSCSQYAVQVLESHGAWKGLWLTIKRLAKCHPWHAGGVDLPPS